VIIYKSALPLLFLMTMAAQTQPAAPPTGARELFVLAGKSVVVDSPAPIIRVAVANDNVASAIIASPREVVVNGKAPGETTLIIWEQTGERQFFDVFVEVRNDRLAAVRRELQRELPGQDITVTPEDGVVFLNGNVKDLNSAERAYAIAGVLGKPVNLLRVAVPETDPQILIKIRFANIDRSAQLQLGLNLISTGATNTIGRTTTGQFTATGPPTISSGNGTAQTNFSVTDALNIFLFRPDLNLGAIIKALQAKALLEILAEPNVLAINGHTANFLSGGEFPFPTLQGGGAGLGAVTIQFREFGVRISFTPTITPRGTIRMNVTPEVSSLDFSNGLVFQGFTIPALATRRVQTTVELESGQSFAIGGMLDNRVVKNLSKIPGLGDIPLLGKLFQSINVQKNNTELLVMVTPEIVRPIPTGAPRPEIPMPDSFLPTEVTSNNLRTPGLQVTGPVPNHPQVKTLPVEQLLRINQELAKQSAAGSLSYQAAPLVEYVPVPMVPDSQQTPGPAQVPNGSAQPPAVPQPQARPGDH
jgi:pilus assembly protein CpaC